MSKILNEALIIIADSGGKCISYTGEINSSRITVECEINHIWETSIKTIRAGHWCRACSQINNGKLASLKLTIHTLEEVQKIVADKGGKCLSDVYKTNMSYVCAFGHEWKATVSSIIWSNSWCPVCSSSLYERISRLYFETIFDKKFPTSYPKWLKNKNNHQLELDGYCEELSLAFEHNGKQHYEAVNFNGTSNEFEKLQENDKIKKELCAQNNVKLIIIPELFSKTKIEKLKDIIGEQCIDLGIKLPAHYNDIVINYKQVYTSNKDMEKLMVLKNKLFSAGYKLLSTEYLGASFKYNVKCVKCGAHRSSVYSALMSHKCSSCSGKNWNITIEDANTMAKKKGGKCLSTIYINNHTKLLWECSNGHQWESHYNNIQNGNWCSQCAKIKRKGISKMKQYSYAELKEEVKQRKLDVEKDRLMRGNCNCNNCDKEIKENEVRSFSIMSPSVICIECDSYALEAITIFCFLLTTAQGKTSWEKFHSLKDKE